MHGGEATKALIEEMHHRVAVLFDAGRYSSAFTRYCAILGAVNGREFISRVRKLGRKNNIAVSFDRTRGKGSHGTLRYGHRITVVKDRKAPLKAGTFHGMCRQLGIDPSDL